MSTDAPFFDRALPSEAGSISFVSPESAPLLATPPAAGGCPLAEMLIPAPLFPLTTYEVLHAKNKIAGRIITFLVLSFWNKNTEICVGAMPYRRDFPTTTRI